MLSITACAILLASLLTMTAYAVYEDMTWQTLNENSSCVQPYTDYESVFDKTKELYLFEDYENDLKTLCGQFPDLVHLEIAGYSELGRPLYVMVMGSDSAPNRMFVLGTTHAREYTGAQLSVLQIEFYLHNYENGVVNGERICDLLDRCQMYFLPMHNPDGAMLSMQGLASLDSDYAYGSLDESERKELTEFLKSQLDVMHASCEADANYHDSDADLYSLNPDPDRSDAFIYWKSNIRGVDLHYSMYDEWMLEKWKTGSWYYNSQESHFSAPSWECYCGTTGRDTEGISLSAENIALNNYINEVKPNFFISYHTASNQVQWNYGYGKMENGEALRTAAGDISERLGKLTGFQVSNASNPHIGHPGWFIYNSQNYMDTCGYGVTLELASRQYLNSVGGRAANYMDAPPTQVIQVTDDVVTDTGLIKYSLWTTCKYTPLSISQYIMDNRLIEEAGRLSGETSETGERPDTEIISILGQNVGQPDGINIMVGGRLLENVERFGTFVPGKASVSAVTAGDILHEGAELCSQDYLVTKEKAYIGKNSTVRFKYTKTGGEKAYACFTVQRLVPVTEVAGMEVEMVDLPQTDGCTRESPTVLVGKGEKNTVTLDAFRSTLKKTDVTVTDAYEAELYTDSTCQVKADEIPLSVGDNDVYLSVASENPEDRAWYRMKIVVPALSNDAGIKEVPSGGIQRGWRLTEHAGTKADPDELEVRVNGTLFGGSTARKLSAFAATRNPEATYQLYSDAAFAEPIESFTLQGGYDSTGFEKTVYLNVVSADGKVARYTKVTFRSWQELLTIDGKEPVFLGLKDASKANASTNPMCLEISLTRSQALENWVHLPRGNGEFLGNYPDVRYTTYDDGSGEEALVIQNKSVTTDNTVPDGYDAYYQVSVWHEDSTKVFYQIQIKFSDVSSEKTETGIESPGSGMPCTWELERRTGDPEDPDILEIRCNAAYFGTTTVRNSKAIAIPKNPRSGVELYEDALFSSQPSDSFTMQGTYEGGYIKTVGLKVTSEDGSRERYYKVNIRCYQELLSVVGMEPVWLGQNISDKGNASGNQMELYLQLDEETIDGFQVNTYPEAITGALLLYDGRSIGAGSEPLWVQNTSYKADTTGGRSGYLKLAVQNGNSKCYYTVWVGTADYGQTQPEELGLYEPEGDNNLRRTWTLTEASGTVSDPDVLEVRGNAAYFGTSTVRKLETIAVCHADSTVTMYSDEGFTEEITGFTMDGSNYAGGFIETVYAKVTSGDGEASRYYRIDLKCCQELAQIAGVDVEYDGAEKKSGGNASANRMILTVELPEEIIESISSYPDVQYVMYDKGLPTVDNNQGAWRNAEKAVSDGWTEPSGGAENYSGAYKIQITYRGANCQYLIWVSSKSHEHEWEEEGVTIIPASCVTEGLVEYGCTKCDAFRREAMPALGHDWSDWAEMKEGRIPSKGTPSEATPSDAQAGKWYIRECGRCHKQETRFVEGPPPAAPDEPDIPEEEDIQDEPDIPEEKDIPEKPDIPVKPVIPPRKKNTESSFVLVRASAKPAALQGIWTLTNRGWTFRTEERGYAEEWAYICNPYANASVGHPAADWFRFDKDGLMVTGWFTDKDGLRYYLDTQSDGRKGALLTGWNKIDGTWYYFNTASDGTRGRMFVDTVTPDGYKVDSEGAWVR